MNARSLLVLEALGPWLGSLGVGVWLAACELGPCTYFEFAPPSAEVRLVDAVTGEALCGLMPQVIFSGGSDAGGVGQEQPLYALEDSCAYEFPGWEQGLGGGELQLSLTGYESASLKLPEAERDACEQLVPPSLELSLTPTP